jgi:hypothetical protein
VSTARFYFFEVVDGHETNYVGTLNEFFGLQAERGASFNGSFVPATAAAPGDLVLVPATWEAAGAALRTESPQSDTLWSEYAQYAKRPPARGGA